MTPPGRLSQLTALAIIACSGRTSPQPSASSQYLAEGRCREDTASSATRLVGDSLSLGLRLPATAAIGDTVLVRFCVKNLTNRPLHLVAYGQRILWHYYVRSSAGSIVSSWETELPLPITGVVVAANQSIESQAHWFTGARFRGGLLRAGPYYIDAVPLLAEPMAFQLVRRILLSDAK